MNTDVIRIGKVSSVNAGSGMVRVTYPDKDDSVTAELPVFSFTDEYKMPKVGSQVLVVHLSNGTSAGVCLGHYWNKSNKPLVSEGFVRSWARRVETLTSNSPAGSLRSMRPKSYLTEA